MYIIIHNLRCGLPNLLLYYTFCLKIKTVKLVNLIKILDKMDEFLGGVAALRGIKKFFSLASLADFRFRK